MAHRPTSEGVDSFLWRGHAGKVAYPSKKNAQARARQLFAKGEAYKCTICHRWHITKKLGRRTARADRIA